MDFIQKIKKKLKSFKSSKEVTFEGRYYSQEGEDIFLKRLFEGQRNGFYVDIGAHHPTRFSNTYHFYKLGWKGINVDAMPESMNAFREMRPRDINIEMGVSDKKATLDFYIFNEAALNTFSKSEAEKKDGLRSFKIEKILKVGVAPLAEILDNCLPSEIERIDFMTIDVEGYDLAVLQSNDWKKYRPKILLVEDLFRQSLPTFINSSELYNYMDALDYELIGKTLNTLFFKDLK